MVVDDKLYQYLRFQKNFEYWKVVRSTGHTKSGVLRFVLEASRIIIDDKRLVSCWFFYHLYMRPLFRILQIDLENNLLV